MNDQLSERLIQAIREQLSEENNLAPVLMEILSLSKEATYRRMRGDVLFTFEDVAKISKSLGISLDKIVGESKITEKNEWAFFNTNMLSPSNYSKYADQLDKRIKVLSEIFLNLQKSTGAVLRYATCFIPFYLTLPYKGLSAFRHYKRAYLTEGTSPEFRLKDMHIPEELYQAERSCLKMCADIPRQLHIMDRKCFLIMVKDIVYFHQRRLISDEEKLQMKDELLSVLLNLEKIATLGKISDGVELSLYLCDVNLESSYVHIESENYESSLQITYFMDLFNIHSPVVSRIQKVWIESLKRYSTLISQTGEMERLEFIKTQRELIESM